MMMLLEVVLETLLLMLFARLLMFLLLLLRLVKVVLMLLLFLVLRWWVSVMSPRVVLKDALLRDLARRRAPHKAARAHVHVDIVRVHARVRCRVWRRHCARRLDSVGVSICVGVAGAHCEACAAGVSLRAGPFSSSGGAGRRRTPAKTSVPGRGASALMRARTPHQLGARTSADGGAPPNERHRASRGSSPLRASWRPSIRAKCSKKGFLR